MDFSVAGERSSVGAVRNSNRVSEQPSRFREGRSNGQSARAPRFQLKVRPRQREGQRPRPLQDREGRPSHQARAQLFQLQVRPRQREGQRPRPWQGREGRPSHQARAQLFQLQARPRQREDQRPRPLQGRAAVTSGASAAFVAGSAASAGRPAAATVAESGEKSAASDASAAFSVAGSATSAGRPMAAAASTSVGGSSASAITSEGRSLSGNAGGRGRVSIGGESGSVESECNRVKRGGSSSDMNRELEIQIERRFGSPSGRGTRLPVPLRRPPPAYAAAMRRSPGPDKSAGDLTRRRVRSEWSRLRAAAFASLERCRKMRFRRTWRSSFEAGKPAVIRRSISCSTASRSRRHS